MILVALISFLMIVLIIAFMLLFLKALGGVKREGEDKGGDTKLEQNETTGEEGERLVEGVLRRLKGPKRLYNGIFLRDSLQITHEIDHVLITPRGVFSIETKNITGYVRGREDDASWEVNLFGKRREIKNPIKQNRVHAKVINRAIGGLVFVEPVTVFVKNNAPWESDVIVNLDALPSRLESEPRRLNRKKRKEVIMLLENAIDKKVTKAEHILAIDYRVRSVRLGRCPICDSVLREVRKMDGVFLECPNRDCGFSQKRMKD